MTLKETYTTPEILEITKVSRQTILRLRKGTQFNSKTGFGKTKLYTYEPILVKDEDWFWQDGHIIYTKSALQKIKRYIKEGEYWKRQQ
jgi:hypothetical protein